ncbi:MAG: RcnB family protein [Panacagrimonas sp.]
MKTKPLLIALLSFGVLISAPVMAHDNDGRHRGHGHHSHHHRDPEHDRHQPHARHHRQQDKNRYRAEHRHDARHRREQERRWHARQHRQEKQRRKAERQYRRALKQQHKYWRQHRHDRYRHARPYRAPRYAPPRGFVRTHFRVGDRLPYAYRKPRYVIHNYPVYRLHQPPRGYEWVRVDRDVVLAAVNSGRIAVVLDRFFV